LSVIGAIDIGGTKIAIGIVTESGTLLHNSEIATNPSAGFDDAMLRTSTVLKKLADEEGASLVGIGVACPGPLNPFTGIIEDVGTLPTWQGGNLMESLGSAFGVPVAVENDADAAVLAEANVGDAQHSNRFIYLTISTGIGGGILLDRKLYRGARGAHPELGHIIIDATNGPLCYCRAHGCWEVLGSGPAITAWFQSQQSTPTSITTAEISRMAEHGDALALKAMDRLGYYLGLGLSNIITAFTPDTIVLGGGVMKSHPLFLPRALAVVDEVCTQVPVKNTQIKVASAHSQAGLLGAAQAWLSRYR
jgi:glucokinase